MLATDAFQRLSNFRETYTDNALQHACKSVFLTLPNPPFVSVSSVLVSRWLYGICPQVFTVFPSCGEHACGFLPTRCMCRRTVRDRAVSVEVPSNLINVQKHGGYSSHFR